MSEIFLDKFYDSSDPTKGPGLELFVCLVSAHLCLWGTGTPRVTGHRFQGHTSLQGKAREQVSGEFSAEGELLQAEGGIKESVKEVAFSLALQAD